MIRIMEIRRTNGRLYSVHDTNGVRPSTVQTPSLFSDVETGFLTSHSGPESCPEEFKLSKR